jgi:hypothetical protein
MAKTQILKQDLEALKTDVRSYLQLFGNVKARLIAVPAKPGESKTRIRLLLPKAKRREFALYTDSLIKVMPHFRKQTIATLARWQSYLNGLSINAKGQLATPTAKKN